MKWFKHYVDNRDDEGVRELKRQFGVHKGYAIWFMTLEIVCKEYTRTDSPSICLTFSEWREKLRLSSKLMKSYGEVLQKFLNCKVIINEKKMSIEIPNLLKIRDEYSRKSGVGTDKVPPKTKEIRLKTKENIRDISKTAKPKKKNAPPKPKTYSDNFNKAWEKYPNRDGKKESYRHYSATVKTDQDYSDLLKAIDNYVTVVNAENTGRENGKRRPWKNGPTFFNNWQDYIDFKAPAEEEYVSPREILRQFEQEAKNA